MIHVAYEPNDIYNILDVSGGISAMPAKVTLETGSKTVAVTSYYATGRRLLTVKWRAPVAITFIVQISLQV